MTRTVFKVRVITRDIISDFLARFKSILGGRVKVYERAIQQAIDEAYEELRKEHPKIRNVRFGTTEMIKDGAEIIVYGEVDDEKPKTNKKRN